MPVGAAVLALVALYHSESIGLLYGAGTTSPRDAGCQLMLLMPFSLEGQLGLLSNVLKLLPTWSRPILTGRATLAGSTSAVQ